MFTFASIFISSEGSKVSLCDIASKQLSHPFEHIVTAPVLVIVADPVSDKLVWPRNKMKNA